MLDRSCIEAIDPLLEILDGKWTLPLLLELFVGPRDSESCGEGCTRSARKR